MGPWDGLGLGTGIAPQAPTQLPPPRVHPHQPQYTPAAQRGQSARLNSAVGLRTVDQLSLSVHFSGSKGITEVYNLVLAGNPNDHNVIPVTKQAGVSNLWTGPIFSQQSSIKLYISPILDHEISEVGILRDLRASGDHLAGGSGGSILGQF